MCWGGLEFCLLSQTKSWLDWAEINKLRDTRPTQMDHSLDRAKKNAFLMIINTDIILVYEMMLVHIKKRMRVVFV